MQDERDPPRAGGTSGGPVKDTMAETGPGIPDDAVGKDQQTVADQVELSESENAEAMAAKLQAEADARWRTGKRSR